MPVIKRMAIRQPKVLRLIFQISLKGRMIVKYSLGSRALEHEMDALRRPIKRPGTMIARVQRPKTNCSHAYKTGTARQ